MLMEQLLEDLPRPQRLSLAYCPADMRAALASLLAFDHRLSQLVRQGREPMLAQMRLAWWRDMLGKPQDERPTGDAVLDALGVWQGNTLPLIQMVDGWEVLLDEKFTGQSALDHSAARSGAIVALAGPQDTALVSLLTQRWAIADLISNLGDAEERAEALIAAARLQKDGVRLPRKWRSIAILGGLAGRSLARGGAPLLDNAASAALALRIGLLGR